MTDHRALTWRELEVLDDLTGEWMRPMDIGARDGSDHSAVLARLVRKGYAERRLRGSLAGVRASYLYRLKQASA